MTGAASVLHWSGMAWPGGRGRGRGRWGEGNGGGDLGRLGEKEQEKRRRRKADGARSEAAGRADARVGGELVSGTRFGASSEAKGG